MNLLKYLFNSFFFLSLACSAGSAIAYTVQPMVMEVTTGGSGNNGQFIISNVGGAEPLPVSITPLRVDLKADGSVEEVDASGDLLIFPPTAIIPKDGEQVIRIQYTGDNNLDRAIAYRVEVENVPLELDGSSSGVRFKTQFRALLFVVPPGAFPDLSVVDISERDAEGYTTVTVKNSGNHFVTLVTSGLKMVNDSGQTLVMNSQDVAQNVKGSIIFPLAERDVKIATPVEFGIIKSLEFMTQ